ncbi:energy-coupling factor ABC transporter ATP-binding protein [Dongia sp.]|uniref:energy-coupling factor ABC transporter ATP-binding protein n=1 Tax=Dongia sp. TaxID=1977262 RepID=UPI0035AF9D45
MLELIDADYAYPGGITALSAVNIAIRPGEKVALLGANGAGKTTLLNVLNGTLRPAGGALQLDGQPVRYDRGGLRHLRQRVGMVLQDPDDQLFAASVFEDVSFGPSNLDLGEAMVAQRVTAALEAMQVVDLADRPTHMLSFGQRKRVAIAGILAMEPRYLLLDEPSAGLDPDGVGQLMSALGNVSQAGTAIVMATHDMDAAYAWADRILIFGEGRIAAAGDPEAVFVDRDLLSRLRLTPPLLWEIGELLRRSKVGAARPLPISRQRHGILSEIEALVSRIGD